MKLLYKVPLLALATTSTLSLYAKKNTNPNVIVIFCDDMGYGDLSCYGHPTIKTPNLDKMAIEGQKWTSYYAAASVSTPSRAGLLTGRYPVRNNQAQVYFPFSDGGLPATEKTIATVLKDKNYVTACVGKWHLGHKDEYMPWSHGFDYFFGIPYSNDMSKKEQKLMGFPDYKYELPFYNQKEIIEYEPDQREFTKRFTNYAVDFIRKNKKEPFFLYLAHPMPHVPVYASQSFSKRSDRGTYGDAVEEVDWSVGEILKTLKDLKIDKNTLVVFASDNGPWLSEKENGGSAGCLSEGKGSSFEGGFRVPGIFWGPGIVSPGIVTDMGSTLDLLPTVCDLADIDIPVDRTFDGVSLVNVLKNKEKSKRKEFFFYRGNDLFAVRVNDYKVHYSVKPVYSSEPTVKLESPLLYHMGIDPQEKNDISIKNPEMLNRVREITENHLKTIRQF